MRSCHQFTMQRVRHEFVTHVTRVARARRLPETSHQRIAEAVLSVFGVTREVGCERGIPIDGYDQVLPASRSLKCPPPRFRLARCDVERRVVRRIAIEDTRTDG